MDSNHRLLTESRLLVFSFSWSTWVMPASVSGTALGWAGRHGPEDGEKLRVGEPRRCRGRGGGEGMEPRFSNSDLSLDLNGCSREGEGRAQIPVCLKTVSKKLVILLHIQVWQDWKTGALHLCVWFLSSSSASPSPTHTGYPRGPWEACVRGSLGPRLPSTGRGYTSCKILDMQSEDTLRGEMCHWGIRSSETNSCKLEELRRSEDKWESCSGAGTWWLLSRNWVLSSCSWECPGSGRSTGRSVRLPPEDTTEHTDRGYIFSLSEGQKLHSKS